MYSKSSFAFANSCLLVFIALLIGCEGSERTPGTGGRSNTPASCVADFTDYVTNNIDKSTITAWEGGAYYDKWWAVKQNTAPVTTHPLWSEQSTNIRTGADTWRCKECHGWDYKGAEGAYGDTSNNHYTGFPGVIEAAAKDPIDVFCAIRNGTGINAKHVFNTGNTAGVITNEIILNITKFITDQNDQGMVNVDDFIDANGSALGSAASGQTEFATCGTGDCHGPSGLLRAGGGTLGDLARENPWEVLHKIRNGHPGSRMPAFAGGIDTLTPAQMRNVLAYTQTLPGANTTPTTPQNCEQDMQTFVNDNFSNARAWIGGRLYDKWWTEAGVSAPVNNHPLWATQTTNTRTGGDTWRCKECHGWDYLGDAGAYGDTANSHYTGFPGVLANNIQNKTPVAVFCAIREGTGIDARHRFNSTNTNNGLSDARLLDLTKFILDANQQGVIDMSTYINPTTGIASGNANSGKNIFDNTNTSQGCANSSCHGPFGFLNAGGESIGLLADENPWEVLHKIRNGHPGTPMPSFVRNFSATQVRDVLAHTQTLPDNTGGGTCTTDMVDFVTTGMANTNITPWDGGALYDKWWTALNGTAPTTTHPLFATQNSNTRTGADTWRCKECHGWDYKGKEGAYGNTSNSHYTGFPGIFNSVNKAPIDLFCAIRDGQGINNLHKFNGTNTNGALADLEIVRLVKFITTAGDNGLTNSDEYIDATTKDALGDAGTGQTIYNTVANCDSCHGADGTQGFDDPTVTLGDLSNDNPWEVLHKIRYGHPGSDMPAYIDDDLTEELNVADIKNVLTYVQTLATTTPPDPGNGGGGNGGGNGNTDPANCLTDLAGYVSGEYANVSAIKGGELYDNWWSALGYQNGPTQDHPVWAEQTTNTRTGESTWRCKECHGWDYKGKDGAYDDTANSHYTGFPGVMDAKGMSSLEVFCAIYNGTSGMPEHKFNPRNSQITDLAVLQLTKFLTSEAGGIFDMDAYINPETRKIVGGNATSGAAPYNLTCKNCHGTDGTESVPDGTLGKLANENPWEVLHKINYGNPGSIMEPFFNTFSFADKRNILAYLQTLPKTAGGGGTTPPPSTDVEMLVLGGLLYDNWIVVKDVDPPKGDNSLWDLQNTNNRTGADTWRCKECHGWDYKGKDGQYGPGNSHYTGFAGVLTVAKDEGQTEDDVYNWITNGFVLPSTGKRVHNHDKLLTEEERRALAKFIKNGVINTDLYIFPSVGVAKGDKDRGELLFMTNDSDIPSGDCAECHGNDGKTINFGSRRRPVYLGDVAVTEPWEVLHKARFGQPGEAMPSMVLKGLPIGATMDVLTFAQSLPRASSNND